MYGRLDAAGFIVKGVYAAIDNLREVEMKLLLALACFFFSTSYFAYSAAAPQTFPTSAGEGRITPLYHASPPIEAGGKTTYLEPAKPGKVPGSSKAEPIPSTHAHPDHTHPASISEISKS